MKTKLKHRPRPARCGGGPSTTRTEVYFRCSVPGRRSRGSCHASPESIGPASRALARLHDHRFPSGAVAKEAIHDLRAASGGAPIGHKSRYISRVPMGCNREPFFRPSRSRARAGRTPWQ